MRNLIRFIGLRSLQARFVRTFLALLGISFGVALFVAISMINGATNSFFRNSLQAITGKAALSVRAGELGFDQRAGEALEKIEGVKDAVPVVETRSWLLNTHESIMVLGVDLLQERAVRDYQTEGKAVVGDSLSFIARPDSIMITASFAKSHGLRRGDRLELLTTRGRSAFVVRGILTPRGVATAYGGGLAVMDIDAARLAFGKEGKSDRVDIVTEPGANIEAVAERIRGHLGSSFTVARPEAFSDQMDRMIGSFQWMSAFLSSLALIVGALLISNSMSISIAERHKEIGTLRALGAKKSQILLLFLAEASVMGGTGAFFGAFLGRGIASRMIASVTRAMSQQFQRRIEASDLQFSALTVISAVALGVFAASLAALWPAYKATTIRPVEAMKMGLKDGSDASTGGERSGWAGLFLMVVALGLPYTGLGGKTGSLIAQGVGAVGAMLLGPALVLLFIGALRPLVGWKLGVIPRLAIENILRNPKRTLANLMGLVVALTLVVAISCIQASFKGTLVNYFKRVLRSELVISATGRMQSHETQSLDESVKNKIEAYLGVLGAYALRELKFKYANDEIILKMVGEPPKRAGVASRYDLFERVDGDSEVGGREFFQAPDPTVMISENFALHYAKKTGDRLELRGPDGPRSFRIAGVVSEFANPRGTVLMSQRTYVAFMHDPLVSGFAVMLQPGIDPAEARLELDRRLDHSLTILLNSDILQQVDQVLDSSFAYTRAIESVALLVSLLGLMNTLLIMVMRRTREIGLSRAVGMTRWHIGGVILLEALGQGGLGGLVAGVLGSALGFVWVTHNLADSLGWVIRFHAPWSALSSALALGLLASLVAAGYPIWRATRFQIVDALSYE